MKRTVLPYCALVLLSLTLLAGCGAKDVVQGKRDAEGWVDDKAIMLAIEKDFLADDEIRFVDFNAYSYNGHVYIVGLYTKRSQVDRAVAISQSYEGVTKVSTYFLPKGKGKQCNTIERIDIGTKVRSTLIADKTIWASDIAVDVLHCSIVLLGIVDTQQQKDDAEAHAIHTIGVDKVKNFLQVRD